MDPFTTPESRNSGAWAHPPRKPSTRPLRWWLAIVAAAAFTGFAIFAADRALPSIAATAIEAERMADIYNEGF